MAYRQMGAALLAAALQLGCGAGSSGGDSAATLDQLRNAIATPVHGQDHNERNSRLVQQVTEEGYLQNMPRHEVAQAIGKGESCARHPVCEEQGFLSSDWYYDVGSMGESFTRARPVLIVGFDSAGRVNRTYNLRIH